MRDHRFLAAFLGTTRANDCCTTNSFFSRAIAHLSSSSSSSSCPLDRFSIRPISPCRIIIIMSSPPSLPQCSTTAAMAVADSSSAFTQAAINFYGSVRFPAVLIAGSSVAALFSLIGPATQQPQYHTLLHGSNRNRKDTHSSSSSHLNRAEALVLSLYHAIALLSFCLSMTAVVTTTTASTSLLLGRNKYDPSSYSDVYHFLRGAMTLEFVLTRWSFLVSLLLFLTGVGSRLLLELQLLKPGRQQHACTVVLTLIAFMATMVSQINCTLNCWPNLLAMTLELFQLLWRRNWETKAPLRLLSFFAFIGATACAMYSFMSQFLLAFKRR